MLEVCENCVNFGKEIIETNPVQIEKKKEIEDLSFYKEENSFVENYGKLIVETRGKKGLNREQFAEKIKERESLIKRVENEEMAPDDALTYKIERFLEIKLKKPYEEKYTERKTAKKPDLTIGDIVEVE